MSQNVESKSDAAEARTPAKRKMGVRDRLHFIIGGF
jgi:hypothetical protein